MKKKNKHRIAIFLISSLCTYFIFKAIRVLAVIERGNNFFGGEIMLLLIPVIAIFVYENIILTLDTNKKFNKS